MTSERREEHRRDSPRSLTSGITLERFSFLYGGIVKLFRVYVLAVYFPRELFAFFFKKQSDIKLSARILFGLISYDVDTTKDKDGRGSIIGPLQLLFETSGAFIATISIVFYAVGIVLPKVRITPIIAGIPFVDEVIFFSFIIVCILVYSLSSALFVSCFTNKHTTWKNILDFAVYSISVWILSLSIGVMCITIIYTGLFVVFLHFQESIGFLMSSPWKFSLVLIGFPVFIFIWLSNYFMVEVSLRLFAANPVVVLSEIMGQESWRIAIMFGAAMLLAVGVTVVAGHAL